MIYLAISFGTCIVVIIFQMVIIKDLMDRVMSRGLGEYKAIKDKSETEEPQSMSDRSEYEIYCKRQGITPQKEVS